MVGEPKLSEALHALKLALALLDECEQGVAAVLVQQVIEIVTDEMEK